ncbi:MAG: hypothetical protein HY033_04675 [Ignavibacteriae bacterium]|nr:hypothetical protein [Ignavibacteria bacterium]MBI3364183.1 hypothetical protein [Ignavibacteriota bacterium]
MNGKRNIVPVVSLLLIVTVVGLLNLSCSQYDYSSPIPGLVDVRLRTITDTSKIPFSPLNNFVLKVVEVVAVRSDLAYAKIYADLKALNRTTGVYNTLDYRARDSSLVIGQGFLPPGDYLGILMIVQPGDFVVLDGYRSIRVTTPPRFDTALKFRQPFHVSEQRTTRIVLTIDLSKSLLPQVDTYLFNPLYYISSIQYE